MTKVLRDHHRDQHDDLLVATLSGFVDERDDRVDYRRVLGVDDSQRHTGVPLAPLLSKVSGCTFPLLSLVNHNGDGDHLLSERQRFGDGVLGEARDSDDRDDHQGPFTVWLRRHRPHTQRDTGSPVVHVDALEQQDEGRDGHNDHPRSLQEL